MGKNSLTLKPKIGYPAHMFLDEAIITVTGGHGGKGCVGFRREKFVPMGGPNGGDGGDGGSVFVIADENADTLSAYASAKKFQAEAGGFGLGQLCGGKNGQDLYLKVPPGTVVTQVAGDGLPEGETQMLLGDLRRHGDIVMLSRGGRGGYGNAHFTSSTRQAPDFAELGEPGEERVVKLELKLVADVGIIGYPSVGKSTLISVISAARPKIAAYHFTTLVPNLGVVQAHDRRYVVCDVPGLIEGASEGKGLGHEFLRHIERCGALLHLLDIERAFAGGSDLDASLLVNDYRAIRNELEAYSPALAEKRELVVLNKADLVNFETKEIEKALKKAGIEVFAAISSATRSGVDDMVSRLLPVVLEERELRQKREEELEEQEAKEIPVLRPHVDEARMRSYRIDAQPDGSIKVTGRRLEQFTVMTDFSKPNAVRRFRDVIERIGLVKALEKLRQASRGPVFIGKTEVADYL